MAYEITLETDGDGDEFVQITKDGSPIDKLPHQGYHYKPDLTGNPSNFKIIGTDGTQILKVNYADLAVPSGSDTDKDTALTDIFMTGGNGTGGDVNVTNASLTVSSNQLTATAPFTSHTAANILYRLEQFYKSSFAAINRDSISLAVKILGAELNHFINVSAGDFADNLNSLDLTQEALDNWHVVTGFADNAGSPHYAYFLIQPASAFEINTNTVFVAMKADGSDMVTAVYLSNSLGAIALPTWTPADDSDPSVIDTVLSGFTRQLSIPAYAQKSLNVTVQSPYLKKLVYGTADGVGVANAGTLIILNFGIGQLGGWNIINANSVSAYVTFVDFEGNTVLMLTIPKAEIDLDSNITQAGYVTVPNTNCVQAQNVYGIYVSTNPLDKTDNTGLTNGLHIELLCIS